MHINDSKKLIKSPSKSNQTNKRKLSGIGKEVDGKP